MSYFQNLSRMRPKPTHEEVRKTICCCCKEKKKSCRNIIEHQEQLVKAILYEHYDKNVVWYPRGICDSCRKNLAHINKQVGILNAEAIIEAKAKIPEALLRKWNLPLPRRERCRNNSCSLCQITTDVSKFNFSKKTSDHAAPPRTTAGIEPRQSSAAFTPQKSSPIAQLRCKYCLQKYGKGISHICSKAERAKSLTEALDKSPPSVRDTVVASILRKKAVATSAEPSTSVVGEVHEELGEQEAPTTPGETVMQLQSVHGGQPMKLNILSRVEEAGQSKSLKRKVEQVVEVETLQEMQKVLKLSQRQVRALCGGLRKKVKVEEQAESKLIKESHALDDFYEVVKISIETSDGVSEYRDLVYVKNVNELLEHVINCRELEKENTMFRVGIDGGGGSFKVMSNIFEPKEKKEKGKLLGSGVGKGIILAYVENMPERYKNISLIFDYLDLFDCPHILVGDLKIINMLLGLSSHGGKHACPFCEGTCSLESGSLRDFASLHSWCSKYQELGSNKKQMHKFKNVINECIIDQEASEKVLHVIPPPELHILMGIVNHIVKHLEGTWPEFEQWRIKQLITKHGYQGGGYDGNNCRKILRAVKALENALPEGLKQYSTTLEAFQNVVVGCFSESLNANFKTEIEEFKNQFEKLQQFTETDLQKKISVTWKIHVLVAHVPYFIENVAACGLAKYSEQTCEGTHSSMKHVEKRFKVSVANPKHAEKSKRAVSLYSSGNL